MTIKIEEVKKYLIHLKIWVRKTRTWFTYIILKTPNTNKKSLLILNTKSFQLYWRRIILISKTLKWRRCTYWVWSGWISTKHIYYLSNSSKVLLGIESVYLLIIGQKLTLDQFQIRIYFRMIKIGLIYMEQVTVVISQPNILINMWKLMQNSKRIS